MEYGNVARYYIFYAQRQNLTVIIKEKTRHIESTDIFKVSENLPGAPIITWRNKSAR